MLKKDIVVVLDNIRSTYNVGSIFRTADAAGVDKLYLCGITPCPPHPKIAKVALGAEKYVSWEHYSLTWRLLKTLHKEGYYIVALEQGSRTKDIFHIKKIPHQKIALVIGPEVRGISSKILKRADLQLEIPMEGKKESLNVAVAFGIAIYKIAFNFSKKS